MCGKIEIISNMIDSLINNVKDQTIYHQSRVMEYYTSKKTKNSYEST